MDLIISWFLIPVLTIMAAGPDNWFTLNFSVVGSSFPGNILLLFWAILIGSYYRTVVTGLLSRTDHLISVTKEPVMIDLSVCLLILTALLPYRPQIQPVISFLHLSAALSSTIIFYTAITMITQKLYSLDPRLFSLTAALLLFSICISFSLLILCNFLITSVLEIYLTLFSCFWLRLLNRRLSVFIRRKRMITRSSG